MQVRIARILRVDGNGRVTEHGFRAGGRKLKHLARFLHGVKQMPEAAVLLLVLHLRVRNGRVAMGAPVHEPVPAVDLAFFIQAHEHFLHRVGAAFIHREAFTLPIAARTELAQLLHDAVAVGVLPVPCARKEAVAAEHILREPFLCHGFHDLCLRRDGSMVRAGQPERFEARHALIANDRVLKRLIERMPHVELAGDVRWGDHDAVRRLAAVGLRVKVSVLLPGFIEPAFHSAVVIGFGHFPVHWVVPPVLFVHNKIIK